MPTRMAALQKDENVEVDEYLHIVKVHVLSAFDYLSGRS